MIRWPAILAGRPGPILALALAVAAAFACDPPEGGGVSEPRPEGKGKAPEFILPDLGGQEVSLDSLRGGPVVIDFWATWCAPCVHQIPVLNQFQEQHPQIPVLGVSVDVDGRKVVPPFAEEHQIGYRVLLGDEALARRYGAMGFPSLYVIDSEGSIAEAHVGVVTLEELEAAVEALDGAG